RRRRCPADARIRPPPPRPQCGTGGQSLGRYLRLKTSETRLLGKQSVVSQFTETPHPLRKAQGFSRTTGVAIMGWDSQLFRAPPLYCLGIFRLCFVALLFTFSASWGSACFSPGAWNPMIALPALTCLHRGSLHFSLRTRPHPYLETIWIGENTRTS